MTNLIMRHSNYQIQYALNTGSARANKPAVICLLLVYTLLAVVSPYVHTCTEGANPCRLAASKPVHAFGVRLASQTDSSYWISSTQHCAACIWALSNNDYCQAIVLASSVYYGIEFSGPDECRYSRIGVLSTRTRAPPRAQSIY